MQFDNGDYLRMKVAVWFPFFTLADNTWSQSCTINKVKKIGLSCTNVLFIDIHQHHALL